VRLLCDHNVDDKYTDAFRRAEWITVRPLRELLSIETPDSGVASYVDEHEWVVFTSDVRFLSADQEDVEQELEDAEFGIIHYRQAADPSPGDVLAALRRIADVYVDHSEIETHVPDDWVQE
jgi:hypothetical protein